MEYDREEKDCKRTVNAGARISLVLIATFVLCGILFSNL